MVAITNRTIASTLGSATRARGYKVESLPRRSSAEMLRSIDRHLCRLWWCEGATWTEIKEAIGMAAEIVKCEQARWDSTLARKAELDAVIAYYRIVYRQAQIAERRDRPTPVKPVYITSLGRTRTAA